MKVLFVTSEASPFVQSGGLGDVSGALPRAINECGDEMVVECILPLYRCIDSVYKKDMKKVCDLEFKLSWRDTGATVYSLFHMGVTYYFVENSYYFDRDALYGEYDEAERFAFFGRTIAEFVNYTENKPEIIHANDWQAASAIIYLKLLYSDLSIKTVFTIHNIEFQGKFDSYILGDVFGLDNSKLELMCHNGCINLLKAGMLLADKVTTVSPNYACELQHDYFSFGLSDVVRSLHDNPVGIVNGIDYNCFSPDKGGEIDYKYTARTVRSGKSKNKASLLTELSMDTCVDKPLLAMVTRLTEQKGIDLLLGIIDELLALDLQLVVIGTGEKRYEDELLRLNAIYPNLKAIIKFDRALAKKLYAAADMFLMPSRGEPCGLAQMIAAAYGTVPIVRAVGGLYDTVIPYGVEGAFGFRFDNFNAHELLFTVKLALSVYKNSEQWHILRKSAINQDFSWNNSAKKYVSIYKELTE